MANVEDYIEDIPEVKEDKTSDDEDLDTQRESLAILASLGSTEEFLGKAMSLGDIKRLSPKQVKKYLYSIQDRNGKESIDRMGRVSHLRSECSYLLRYSRG